MCVAIVMSCSSLVNGVYLFQCREWVIWSKDILTAEKMGAVESSPLVPFGGIEANCDLNNNRWHQPRHLSDYTIMNVIHYAMNKADSLPQKKIQGEKRTWVHKPSNPRLPPPPRKPSQSSSCCILQEGCILGKDTFGPLCKGKAMAQGGLRKVVWM